MLYNIYHISYAIYHHVPYAIAYINHKLHTHVTLRVCILYLSRSECGRNGTVRRGVRVRVRWSLMGLFKVDLKTRLTGVQLVLFISLVLVFGRRRYTIKGERSLEGHLLTFSLSFPVFCWAWMGLVRVRVCICVWWRIDSAYPRRCYFFSLYEL